MKRLILILIIFLISSCAFSQEVKKAIVYQPPDYVRAYKGWVLGLPSQTYSSTFTKLLGIESGTFSFFDMLNMTGAGSTTITGTYPNFTITSSSDAVTDGMPTGFTISGTASKTLTLQRLNMSDLTVSFTDLNEGATYYAGTGISISNDTIINTVVNTDAQTLSLITDSLGISSGNKVYLGEYNDVYYAGTGISISNDSIINSAPDQTVSITGGTGITKSGTYPIFTITNSAPDQIVSITGSGGLTGSGTYPSLTVAMPTGTENQTLNHNGTAWAATSIIRVLPDRTGVVIGASNNSIASATNVYSSILGGYNNDIEGDYSDYCVIGGGKDNTVVTNRHYCVIGGGLMNEIIGNYSVIPGGNYLKIGGGSFGFRGRLQEAFWKTDLSAEINTAHFAQCNFKQHNGYTVFANHASAGRDTAFVLMDETGLIFPEIAFYRAGANINITGREISASATMTSDGIPTSADFSILYEGSNEQILTIYRQNMSSITASFLDSDFQFLDLINDSLFLSGANGVDLSVYLDNTDSQTLSLVADSLGISNGNKVYLGDYINEDYTFLAPLFNNSNTISIAQASITGSGYLTALDWGTFNSKQDAITAIAPLELSSGTLSIDTTGMTNTDSQTLSESSGTLTISGGNSLDMTTKFHSQSGVSIDCDDGNYFICECSASSTITLSNVVTGLNYFILIKNTGLSNITITLPQTADISEETAIILPPSNYIETAFIYSGTYRIWAMSNNLELHE